MPSLQLEPVPLRAGSQIGPYLIESVAAHSGMASIFRASDLRTGRPVAIKIPHPEMQNDPVFVARFEREGEIGARLDHPGVMKVLATESLDTPYIVMEWVEGRELRKFLMQHRKVTPPRAVTIMAGICRAVDYIHARGVVHRDLKPENVMIDDTDRIRLIDFGIASCENVRRVTFGALSQVMGSPDYISPEQVAGQPGDARSDIYALGVILYEILTGQTPFRGPNAFAVMNDRLVSNPIPPRELNPAISPELQEVIYRALRREPTTRYASAAEFAWDLEHLDSVKTADRPELRDWSWRRRPWIKTISVYLCLALIPIVTFALLLQAAR